MRFATVLDVGANRGQFALFAKTTWPNAQVISFEPLPKPAALLREVFGDAIEVVQTALSDEIGEAKMFVTEHDDSSSLLPIGENQARISGTKVASVEEAVRLTTLDAFLANHHSSAPVLLKIDVQGNELKVLRGAVESFAQIGTIYCECSYVELYEGQALAEEVAAFLAGYNFEVTGVFNQSASASLGQVQADFLFQRKGAL
ncbi:MAG: FkbM family methyltransferase [Candidatus Andeanibacterium colombiense]|uniref:FkbM family methyltransferase n=1 Tax=Candidatus Andeanibacterium colombiense TaxID=3121345 RepID=A0AAJ5X796_9SPHN|nr:MAG: FkbM family methyltransferase [Sphingomonadaceae bacterium]